MLAKWNTMRKMNVLFVLFLLTFTEARKRKPDISPDAVDIYPQKFSHPVDFGHVYREGFGSDSMADRDPRDMPAYPSESGRYEELMPPAIFESPRTEDEYHSKHGDHEVPNAEAQPVRDTMWMDFPALLLRNIQNPPAPQLPRVEIMTDKNNMRRPPPELGANDNLDHKSQYFGRGFDLSKRGDELEERNWTNCEEIGRRAKFHPADVLDIVWLPFYVWTVGLNPKAYIHQFMRPTQRVVREYREQYGAYLNKKIDWEQPKLLMRTLFIDQLLIAGDRKGLFYLIMDINLPDHVRGTNIVLPLVSIRLKRYKRYLMYMNCDKSEPYISVMAIYGEGPTTDEEKNKIGQTFNIRGYGQPVKRDLDDEREMIEVYQNAKMEHERNKNLTVGEYSMLPPKF